MRLLAVIEASTITGPARNLLEFARHSKAQGIETVIATFVRGETSNLFTRMAQAQGTTVETVPESGAWDSAVPGRLRELAARVRPDVVQTHAVKSHFLLRRSGLGNRVPWVAFHHGYTWPTFKARMYNHLDRWSLRAPRQVLTVSRPFAAELVGKGVDADRIEVIHNAIASGWGAASEGTTRALRESLGIPARKKVILIVGRLSREKDHVTLLEAVAQLSPDLEPHLVLVGDGPERTVIEARIRRLAMDNVTLTGQMDSAQPYYGIADVAVLSSLSEGSPNALLEAMSAGVPAVATRVGGIPEIAEDGVSALLVRPSVVDEMRGALERILSDPGLAASLAARSQALIAERYTPEARAAKLASIYRRIT